MHNPSFKPKSPWHLARTAALSLGCFFSLAAAVPAESVFAPLAAQGSIGTIVCKGRGGPFVTNASLVEKSDLVLAVSHFNYRRATGRELPAENCEFQTRDNEGRVIFTSSFSVIERGGRGRELNESFAIDWAVLRLDRAAPGVPLKLAGNKAYNWNNAALASYRPVVRGNSTFQMDVGCRPKRQRHGSIVLLHDCTTKPGWSGAPLLVPMGDRYGLIAIHAKRTKSSGVAIALEGALRKAIEARAKTAA
ncbi:hypothetical protein GRI42_06650 [Erythrobacter gaetbuli]|uniref:Serine protease n=1 Tax=Qipengyuania gaetbuli TaxID=266952 RepID=A0A844XYA5_9SPHN|nr:trypsin-like peptidase domain-containing protein [Qipengyuania gaetbuli]MXO50980.1 hypothetical protein [Qipengyuania gaetbuli]